MGEGLGVLCGGVGVLVLRLFLLALSEANGIHHLLLTKLLHNEQTDTSWQ